MVIIDEGWKETDVIHGRDCKKILGIPRPAARYCVLLNIG
jgi:hypothetical protein